MRLLSSVLTLLLATGASVPLFAASPLRVFASPAVGQALATVIPAAKQAGFDVSMKGEAASSTGIQLLAAGEADAIFTVRPLTGEDRAVAPEKQFVEYRVATQAVAVIVSRDVWESGVRALSKQQLRRVYEREITNWSALGGANREIKFYNVQQGHGIWEQFAQWAYGEIRRAPLGGFETVVGGEDARNALEFNGGAMSLAAPRWADGKQVFALALRNDDEPPVAPSVETFADRSYPLSRPMMVVFPDKPTGPRADLLEFLLGAKCQELFLKADLVPARPPAAQ